MMLVEAMQFRLTVAAGERGDVIHVRFGDHGFHGGVSIPSSELKSTVLVPQGAQVVTRAESAAEQGHRAGARKLCGKGMKTRAQVAIEPVLSIGINVEFRAVMPGERLARALASCRGNGGIVLSIVEHDGTFDSRRFIEMGFDSSSVVGDCRVGIAARGREVRE